MLELQDLKDFSIHNWYDKFKHISLKTILLEVPPELLAKFQSGDLDIDIEEVCSSDFMEKLKNAINSLNGIAFVKNNWHAPMDAKAFSIGNELKVTNLNELITYLSVSNVILEDFSSGKDIPFFIALKPWKEIHPASEFRCIIINNILRAIAPRDCTTYNCYFKEDSHHIIETLTNFYNENIKDRFPRRHYVFDVIYTHPDEPCLIDFGPLNSKTNFYVFSWKELKSLLTEETPEEIPPVLRYLPKDIGIMTKADALAKFANVFN